MKHHAQVLTLSHRAVLGIVVSCALACSARAETRADSGMAALRSLTIESATIQSLEHQAGPTASAANGHSDAVPSTVLKIHLSPAKGSNINVEIWLPDAEKWNGRLIGLGNGGSAGHIHSDALKHECAQGFAAVTTDMGTAPDANSGVRNPEVWKDFGYRATHLMTVVAKQVVSTYYGKPAERCYFSGHSTGGQQAIQEAQRFPDDYDGIVAGVPAHCRTPLHAYFLWNDQVLSQCAFTDAQQKMIQQAGIEYLASRQVPALAGKTVADPRVTRKDIDGLIKLVREKDPSLTNAQAQGLFKLFDGPRHTTTGERIFCGVPFGSPFGPAHGNLYPFNWAFDGKKKPAEINFADDMDTYSRVLGPYLNAENPDLSAFDKHGGKMIIMSGSADSLVPYTATLDYYERVVEHCGNLEKAQSFCRFYLIPGLGHGSQATGLGSFDILQKVMDWREKTSIPNEVLCKRTEKGKTVIEMPVYPYPQQTAWDAQTSSYHAVDGPRGGLDRVAERFRPAAKD